MKIVHLSDLHFGRQDEGPLEALRRSLVNVAPDLIVVSGDLTQTASIAEFKAVRVFLDALPCPYLVVPGNHDMPHIGLGERFFNPFHRYRKFISRDLSPVMRFDQAVVAGLNSARAMLPHWNWANGKLSKAQWIELGEMLGPVDGRWRICVFHHPVQEINDSPLDVIVFGKKRAIAALAELKVDLVMTGHVHHAAINVLGSQAHKTVYLSASTSLSSRLREQENGFNLVTVEKEKFVIAHYRLREHGFVQTDRFEHVRH